MKYRPDDLLYTSDDMADSFRNKMFIAFYIHKQLHKFACHREYDNDERVYLSIQEHAHYLDINT